MGNAPAHERVPDTEICLTDQSPPTGAALVAGEAAPSSRGWRPARQLGSPRTVAALAAGSMILVGCSTPFSQSARYDPAVVSAAGTITVSDPKVYSREALINERARELAFLDKLIEGADTVTFKPDAMRETETLSAVTAAFGQTRDPAAGQNFRQAQDRNAIEQEIALLRRQIQYVQLLKDAELIRAALPTQTEPVNSDLGKLTTDVPGSLAGGVAAPSVETALTRLDARLTALTAQLAAEARPVAPTSVTANPFDEFRDRQAYRNLLYAERNARALDELHDRGSAALMRVNLQATVVPDPAHPKLLGVVQVKVDPSTFDDEAKSRFLSEWLDYVNLGPSARGADGKFTQRSTARALQRARVLAIITAGGYEVAVPTAAPTGSIGGLVQDFADAEESRGKDLGQSQGLIDSWRLDPAGPSRQVLESLCSGSLPENLHSTAGQERKLLLEQRHYARTRVLTHQYIRKMEPWLAALGDGGTYAAQVEQEHEAAREYLLSLQAALGSIPGCERTASALQVDAPNMAWGPLMQRLQTAAQTDRARVYEVGPREQVQQMSTVARSANSLALAASIATASPASDRAAEAALGYSRQAMGRATTLERVPSVVGYAVASKQTFGWVLGPRTVIEPEGRIGVEQMIKPYDLSVDMSIPSWWPTLKLKVTTLWGPSPHELADGSLDAGGRKQSTIEVPMQRRSPDLDWLLISAQS